MNDITKRIAALPAEKRKLLLERLKKKNGGGAAHKISRQSRETDTFPLSFAQQRLWFLHQMEPDSFTWNICLSYKVTGQISEKALRYAFDEIVKRHEVLRSTFAIVNGQPEQVIAKEGFLPLSVVDLSNLPASEREAESQRLIVEETERPFDLAKGPLVRGSLLRLDEMESVLILTMHHIVSDAWAIGIFFKELREFYEAFRNGRSHSLPELPIQYADFAVWQREWLKGEVLETQLSYWKQHLGGSLPILQLPTDRPRPSVQTFPGAVESLELPKSLTAALTKLSNQEGKTLFMTLLAAFKILLYRYSGQEDIIVGSPIAGRNRAEIEGLIGCFVNTMVMRTDMSGNPTFRQLLSQVQDVAMGAYAHQELPFEKLVEEVQPERDLSTSPLFQVMFVLQNAPLPGFELSDFTLTPLVSTQKPSRFDLTLYMGERDERLLGAVEYNTDLFDGSTIKRMVGHFETLLESIIANPDLCIADLPILKKEEQHQLVAEWNATQRQYPKDKCFQQLFEAQVERTPETSAVVMGKDELSYGELNRRANRLAHYLRKLGIGPDVLVGIYVERSLEMVIGLLGIMKAGGAYVPLDPSYPKERIGYILKDAQVSVLVTQKQLVRVLPEHKAEVICLDSDGAEICKESASNPVSGSDCANLAYVIYTSGSTGKPKGVGIQHQTLVNFLYSMSKEPGLTQEDVLLAVTTLSFDIAGLELYLPLMVGGRVVLASGEVASDGGRLSEMLTLSGATVMQATPATWRLLLDSGWSGHDKLKILCGGEALPRELANRLLECGASLWNMYGPTETTIWSAVCHIESKGGIVPVGPAIANTQIYLLDRNLRSVPVGVYGELYIGGDGLARGYLNRPELTAEKFIPNPFSKDGARMYRTGDLARRLPNGNIEFQGRIDHQVKIRGFRIELGEIETALTNYPNIDEVVVVARDEEDELKTEKRLVGYMVSKARSAPTVSELRRYLMESLPEYMVPSTFVFLDAFPLTPNGKVDRKALPAPEGIRPELESAYVAPQNEVERAIAGIWQEVLGVKKVGVDDNFFDLGGHSLLLVQVQNKLQAVFNRDLSIIELFKYPTIKAQARYFSLESDDGKDQRDLSKAQDLARKQREALSRPRQVSKRDGATFKYE
ncbi:amino acid adenylation domain-containing protein [candidate division KSB1 bacterium]|nr:amino acid adenylation domain-containing protein [candidate division KSB1 bacterium]NIV70712.1 amino acid adenylation domain-containing protein [Phycisphaerae bacterium]NIR72677.1 amino acid adenylation domain-containing protein [candidate division KSB1 bacterium]NIS23699.1 amino acid adenylation domain-containing protein [candidate division KSB1 bacterium]NIT70619.1 amino acid adenylation domain-containing protein [candidate division KSB1 bacterium]